MPETEAINTVEVYQIIRAQIVHEDDLNSQRLSWFVASQSFLFTAYAIAVSNLPAVKTANIHEQLELLIRLLPLAAMLTCFLIYATILAGTMAMMNLHRLYHQLIKNTPVTLPPVQGYRLTLLFGQAGTLGLPPVFFAVWIVIFIARLR